MKRRLLPRLEALDSRALLSGGLDPTFGSGGYVIRDFMDNSRTETARGLAVQPDGKVLVGGPAVRPDGSTRTDFGIARYNADGTPDTSFGTNGLATVDFEGSFDTIRKILIDPSTQKILAIGVAQTWSKGTFQDDFAVARLHPNGQLDTTFGGGKSPTGKAVVNVSNKDSLADATLDSRGRIVLAGYGVTFDNKPMSDYIFNVLVRLNTNGTPDAGFGSSGRVVGASGLNSSDRWAAIQVQAGDAIAAVGRDGGVDATAKFSAAGVRQSRSLMDLPTNPYDPASKLGASGAVVFQPDGRIVSTGGLWREATGTDVFVVRYLANGQRDATFGSDGLTVTDLYGAGGVRSWEGASAVAVAPDGRIVVGGRIDFDEPTPPAVPQDSLLLRYNDDGSLDDGMAADSTPGDRFGDGGAIIHSFGPNQMEEVSSIIVLTDGRVLMAGFADLGTATDAGGQRIEDWDVVVARFDGTVVLAGGGGSQALATTAPLPDVIPVPAETPSLWPGHARKRRRSG